MAKKAKVEMEPTGKIIAGLGLDPGGEVSAYFTQTCAEYMDPFVPFRSGQLADYTIVGNEIWYDQEYAQYQYYGERRDGSRKINPRNRTRTDHPMATRYWDVVMWAIFADDITQMVQDKIDKG